MSKEDRVEFDYMLEGVLHAKERAEEEKRQRREIARLNARD